MQNSKADNREFKKTTTIIFLNLYFKFISVFQIQFRDSSDSDKQSKWL